MTVDWTRGANNQAYPYVDADTLAVPDVPAAPARRFVRGRRDASSDSELPLCSSTGSSTVSSTSSTSSTTSSSSTVTASRPSCVYQDGTPEVSEACTCVSGSSTVVVSPMSISSVSIITQSCDYSTWPGSSPTITPAPKTVTTDMKGML